MFIDPVLVLPVKPVMMLSNDAPSTDTTTCTIAQPVAVTSTIAGSSLATNIILSRLDPPLIGVPLSVNSLYHPSLLEEREAECPLLPDPT